MTVTRYMGPLVAAGAVAVPPTGDYNDTPGPSAFAHGVGLPDMRYFGVGGGDVTNVLPLWYSTNDILVVDQIPTTLSAVNLIPAAVPVSGTPMTLAAAATGITVVATGGFSLGGNFPTVPANALVIDGTPAWIQLGTLGGGVSCYDPRTALTRIVRVTCAGNETNNTFSYVGADYYGNLVHETITLGTAGVYSGKKAIKFFISGTANGTLSGSNVSVGTGDVFGFNLAAWEFDLVNIQWNAAAITSTTGFTAALALATASTATTARCSRHLCHAVVCVRMEPRSFLSKSARRSWNISQAGLFGNTQF